MIKINLILKFNFKIHIKHHINSYFATKILKKQYEISDLTIVDMIFQKICRINMIDKISIIAFDEHLKQQYNYVLIANHEISN